MLALQVFLALIQLHSFAKVSRFVIYIYTKNNQFNKFNQAI